MVNREAQNVFNSMIEYLEAEVVPLIEMVSIASDSATRISMTNEIDTQREYDVFISHATDSFRSKEAPTGLEPVVTDLQSAPLAIWVRRHCI